MLKPGYTGFKPLVGGGAQRAPLPTRPMGSVGPSGGPSGLRPEAATSDPEPRPHDAALRSTFVDKEEAAMLRAMARLNGDEQKSRGLGNRYSQKNVAKQRARAQEAAAMGLSAMDPLEQHELQRKLAAGYTKVSERAVPVPRVGLGARRQRPALIDIIPHRKAEDEIREEFDNLRRGRAPRRAVRSPTTRRTSSRCATSSTEDAAGGARGGAAAPRRRQAALLRAQIEEEVAERHDFLDNMNGSTAWTPTEDRVLGRSPIDCTI